MHPLLHNRRWLVTYGLLWTALAGALAALLQSLTVSSSQNALLLAGPMSLFYAFQCLTPWFVCRVLPLSKTSPAKLALNHGGAAILATTLWLLIARGIGSELNQEITPPLLIALGLLLYLLSVALHYVFLVVEESKRSAIMARDAELRALKAQINPHFLFNCLNSITALTSADPGRAREMCILLGGFLRSTLGLGEKQTISWGEELRLARSYLDIEQVRFGKRLQVDMTAAETCEECAVPPLLLQPLIENAVKHGIASMIDGGTIRIESVLEGGQLRVRVENEYDPESPSAHRGGLGLRNIQSRLQTRFGGAASLTVRREPTRYFAEMVMPCQKV